MGKKGLYVLPSTWKDEHFNLTYGNNAIFSYETAMNNEKSSIINKLEKSKNFC